MIQNTEPLQQSVVVFSSNYLPMTRVNIKRAIVLLVTGKAEPMHLETDIYWEVRSPNLILQVPACIRLLIQGTERLWKVPPVNRRELLRRDKHQCQYCGSRKKLTIDHILARSKGGKNTWDNLVIACESCNTRKGDRTPQQAGMILHTTPKAPSHPAVMFAEAFWRNQSEIKL
ncbi:HNH endonuclease [Aphanothece hegewaldii CCALA 016]|uniref:HNH endonuclease n=1 Tax=Aphanothece hegewaldii CCALA 016 TaxID=2107694 RepID=A0A2T1LUM0_9CHRO|nr:HNH endonuclease [Aphanothece hegewaldii]PSF35255.1 HNH endonuclease [Aphanothece hegewaldii CCALA 016]